MADEFYGNGIKIASGFDLGAKAPLDTRTVVNTIEERNAHVTNNRAYIGMKVCVLESMKEYIYNGTSWDESGGISDEELQQLITAYEHSQSSHAPSDAQKNSDITKTEIEEKLIGDITTHTHSQYLTEHQDISHLASETYVDTKISDVVNSAPETLDTLNELAKALGNDENFSTTVANQIGTKVDKVEGKSLIENTEIERLKNVDNYDDTELRDLIEDVKTEIDTEISTSLEEKVDKVEGMGLSQNSYTTEEKEKLSNLEQIETSDEAPTDDMVSIWINTSEDNTVDLLARINDQTVASNTTWSSEKINSSIISGVTGGSVDLSMYALKTDIPTIPTELPANGGNSDTVGGYTFWVGTQAEYEAITSKDENTIYIIKEG